LSEQLLANRFVPGDTIQVDSREVVDEDGKGLKDFVFDVISHREVDGEENTETTRAVEAMWH